MPEWIDKANENYNKDVQSQKKKEQLIFIGSASAVFLIIALVVLLPRLQVGFGAFRQTTEPPPSGEKIVWATDKQIREINQISGRWKCLELELDNHPEANKIRRFVGLLRTHEGDDNIEKAAYDLIIQESAQLRKELDINSQIWDYCEN